MMKLGHLLVLFCALALASCGSGGFKDDLRFGSGSTGFDLTGESDTFNVATTRMVYFRFESAANFDNRFVRLYFNKLEQKDFAACASADAHLCVSGFAVSTPGTYQVEGYLVQTVVDIGKETLVAKKTLTLK
jgi:hypothetical protein